MVSTISKANQPNQSPELEITLEEFLQHHDRSPRISDRQSAISV